MDRIKHIEARLLSIAYRYAPLTVLERQLIGDLAYVIELLRQHGIEKSSQYYHSTFGFSMYDKQKEYLGGTLEASDYEYLRSSGMEND